MLFNDKKNIFDFFFRCAAIDYITDMSNSRYRELFGSSPGIGIRDILLLISIKIVTDNRGVCKRGDAELVSQHFKIAIKDFFYKWKGLIDRQYVKEGSNGVELTQRGMDLLLTLESAIEAGRQEFLLYGINKILDK